MASLYFDIRDLFSAVRMGWSGKKIWAGLCGLFIAYFVYSALVVVGYVMSGMTGSELLHTYGLFPGAAPDKVGGLPAILHLVAMVIAAVVLFLTTSMMCKVTYQQLRGDDFYNLGEAFGFIRKHWGGVVFGPIACFALLVLFLVAGMIIGWLAGVIPAVGEIAFAIGFIPIFFAALVAVFIVFAIIASILLAPAIVGTVGEDALEVVIQSFSVCWSQPWRSALYLVWLGISVYVGTVILSGLMTLALGLIGWACGMFMDEKLVGMLQIAQGYLPPVDFSTPILHAYPEMKTIWSDLAETQPNASVIWSGRVLGIMLIMLTGVLLSYVQAAFASGTTLIYVILRKKKDDENMLEWEDPDFTDFDFDGEDEATSEDSDSTEGGTANEEDAAGGSDSSAEK
ncbi:MAG: hypothetical protein CME21_09670 [Gemmatimonadetes bacterium]|nr:hypothetical protein [Gemmatimonadota bacterium]